MLLLAAAYALVRPDARDHGLVLAAAATDGLAANSVSSLSYASPSAGSQLAAAESAHCTYHPSKIELEWTSRNASGRICSLAKQPHMVDASKVWLQYAARAAVTGQAPPTPNAAERRVLSHFKCTHADGSTFIDWIEPLTGIARHPFAAVGCNFTDVDEQEVTLFNISHIIFADGCGTGSGPDNDASAGSPKPSRLLMDLGCATWGGTATEEASLAEGVGTAFGPSMPLFAHKYDDRCLSLNKIHGWEAQQYDNATWWAGVSAVEKAAGRLHFHNVAITEDDTNSSFSYYLQRLAGPQDFVSVKVDIDYVPIEHKIVQDIAERPELTRLVDELFFEYQ